MSSLQFPGDGQVAFLGPFSSWLALLSCSTISHWILAEMDLLSALRRPALSPPLVSRGAVSGGRVLWVAPAGTANTCSSRELLFPHCPLIWSRLAGTHPGQPHWLHSSAATASDFPGTWGRALSIQSQAESWLALRFASKHSQSSNSLSHSAFLLLIHVLEWNNFPGGSFLLGRDQLLWILIWYISEVHKPWETLSSCWQSIKYFLLGLKLFPQPQWGQSHFEREQTRSRNDVTLCGTAFVDLPVVSLHCKTATFDPFFSFSGVQSLRSTQSLAQVHHRGNEASQWCSVPGPSGISSFAC